MQGWRRLAEAIRAEAAGRYDSLADLARGASLSVRTIEELTAGRRTNYRETTLFAVEAALGWEHGSARRIVEGMRPRREVDEGLAAVRDAWPHLSPRDRRAVLALVTELSR